MTRAVARGNGNDRVFSKTGRLKRCRAPLNTATNQCSERVFVGNIGVVHIGHLVAPHPFVECVPDTSVLSDASTRVFIEKKGVGRIGDKYSSDNIIVSGSSRVFCG